ncbi:mitochondrial inner membrane OXA1 [Chlorella sorokiniana]|uniref:Mitochondrial inner membrane OXA1 n=1 Tax=Chlorella sorokiniana TaxID=3076 RepID=A0A2P6TPS9_CHLSO|nr:mitochondrial inner membrane OXA1 [Chlorella sorokiniana]|eukprot:PRW56043.1 mitochondrial inner membrane OXA1 [Chlorella sorokiniana]
MLRQLGRLRLGSLAASGAAAAAAAEGGAAASRGPQSAAAALQLLDRWQQWGGGQGGSGPRLQHTSVRHMSLWSGSGSGSSDGQQSGAAPADGGSSFAASASDVSSSTADVASAAGGAPGISDLFSPAAIVAAAAGAEGDVLAAAAEDSWLGTRLVQNLLVAVHDATGLPWWQSIMVTTLAMRVATLPVMIAQIKNTYRMSQARPEMEALMEYVKEEQARGNMDAAMQHQQRVLQVWKKYNCNPFKSLLGIFVQAPIFIGFFSALRGFAAHKLPSLAEGGALWFTDLTVADPTYMLPALAGLSFLATVELGAADGMEGQPEATRKKMKNAMRVVALAVPLVSTSMPASVFMYWTASNVFSLGQTMMLKVPLVKKVLGLPDLSKLRSGKPDVGPGKPVQTFSQPPRPAAAAAPAAAEAPAAAGEAGAAASKPQFATRRPARPVTYAQPPRQKKK